MHILKKAKEVLLSMLPILAIVVLLFFTIPLMPGGKKLDNEILFTFLIGALLVYVGQVFFLVGIDNSIGTMGELVGSSVSKVKKSWLVPLFGFLFGFLATISEPDVQVLADQVSHVNPSVNKYLLMAVVAVGVGLFVSLSMIRVVRGLSIKKILIISYLLVFAIAPFSGTFTNVAFDSGGVTTGPITVPFILALGIGIASIKGGKNSADASFGTVGLASVGPILAVAILGLIFGRSIPGAAIEEGPVTFTGHLLTTMGDVALGLLPMTAIFLLFQFFIIKLSPKKLIRILLGVVVVYAGLVLFLTGVSYGFSEAGKAIGGGVGGSDMSWILIIIGAVLGFVIVFTEPAINVLGHQVQNVTQGQIKAKTINITLCIGISIAVVFAVLKVLYSIPIWYFVVPGYIISIVLLIFVPDLFVGIAFDSGGVASGPMTATFIMPFVMGICEAVSGQDNILNFAFGAVAMVAMMPLIIIQGLGLIYVFKKKALDRRAVSEEAVLSGGAAAGMDVSGDFDFSGLEE